MKKTMLNRFFYSSTWKSTISPLSFTSFVMDSSAFFNFSSHDFASTIALLNSVMASSNGTSPVYSFLTIASKFSRDSSKLSSFSFFSAIVPPILLLRLRLHL